MQMTEAKTIQRRILQVFKSYIKAREGLQAFLNDHPGSKAEFTNMRVSDGRERHYFVSLENEHDLNAIRGGEYHEVRVREGVNPELSQCAKTLARLK